MSKNELLSQAMQTYDVPSKINLSDSKDSGGNYFPEIGNQQASNACVTWAAVYYQFTYEVAKKNNWNAKNPDNVFSPSYAYNYLNNGENGSVSWEDLEFLLKTQGVVRQTDFAPDNNGTPDFTWYNGTDNTHSKALQRALETRMTNCSFEIFAPENFSEPVITNNKDPQLSRMKWLLSKQKHVLYVVSCSQTWQYMKTTKGEYCVTSCQTFAGGHAMAIVGYDDDIECDLNGNGIIEDFEKGAFLIANSWGENASRHNDGYVWLMYDALNKVSNDSTLNVKDRQPFMHYNFYRYIEVDNFQPQLMAEITIQQTKRNDFSITIGKSSGIQSQDLTQSTFVKNIGGALGFDGKAPDKVQTHMFVFDFTNLYDSNEKFYWINVTDTDSTNKADTIVKKIQWLDSTGNVIKVTGQQSALSGTTGSYHSGISSTGMFLNKSTSTLGIGRTESLSAVIIPSNATKKAVTWSSSNTSVATVDGNGKVTAVGKGTAIITATATDGSGVSASCTYTVVKLVNSISLNKTSSTLLKGKTEQLTATVLPTDASNRSVTWSSSNTSVVKVSSTGLVTYVGKGTATVTATAKDGSGIKASCTYTITDDYGNTIGTAYTVTLHSKTSGGVDISGDVDYFKFTPTSSGTYIIYTTGSTDTKGYLYNASQTQLAYSDDASISGRNFALKYNLTAGATYYIYVGAYSTYTGTYTLEITKGVYSASLASYNQDARRVQMQAEASTILTQLEVHIGSTTYVLKKPSSGSLDATVNGARFKVTFTSKNNGLSTVWTINAKIPATVTGSTQSVYFEFSKGAITDVNSSSFTGFVAYASSMKTGIDPDSNLQAVLNDMAQSGYEFEVRDWDDTLINVTSSTKAATGMKIIKTKASTGKIVEVYYVVLFGDVSGNGDVGDGVISSADSMNVLSYSTGKIILSDISKLAADVDHNGEINSADSLTILQASTKKVIIDQDYAIAEVPDFCYFLDPVAF